MALMQVDYPISDGGSGNVATTTKKYKLIISDLNYRGNNLEAFYTGRRNGKVGFCCCKMFYY